MPAGDTGGGEGATRSPFPGPTMCSRNHKQRYDQGVCAWNIPGARNARVEQRMVLEEGRGLGTMFVNKWEGRTQTSLPLQHIHGDRRGHHLAAVLDGRTEARRVQVSEEGAAVQVWVVEGNGKEAAEKVQKCSAYPYPTWPWAACVPMSSRGDL
eukprot:CAMPEP_0183294438 /NCGR_PEP_ID=MMETSP0160_2-20130417/2786_1 /TAXON_ID=2839 ORGANISM="Odontella Sinensis, Strain Grunow 1884" /NCGR_SAMPLE_ID=MMETSP0160_2 /ASSEMBLY_ACC=CAM_ASM_000250 /LENGTH=153 /DNA_ID=CAMNT_0025455769 /DNA_START=254 /DNA_END=716 /DNA_ORIENTATION=+